MARKVLPRSTLQRLIKPHIMASPTVLGQDTPLEAPEAGPSRIRAADKWVKPNGPPVGVSFGARRLGQDQDVWSQNAWDHVELPEDYLVKAAEIYVMQRSNPVAEDVREQYNTDPARYWDKFYKINQAAFFKDRAWLRSEFPELIECSEADAGPKIVLEVGCGAGNSIFTLMKYNENPSLQVYATDYSYEAVNVVKASPMYPCPEHGKGKIHASVWDITTKPTSSTSTTASDPSESLAQLSLDADTAPTFSSTSRPSPDYFSLPEGIQPGTVDVITVIYVLSALHPTEWEQAIHNLYTALKPGGTLLIRDYARNDLAQIRIKKDRLLDPSIPHLYIRGDGTRVYFFEKEEMRDLLVAQPRSSRPEETAQLERGNGMFEILQLDTDRRMIVNRKEKKQMYRIHLQVKAKKAVGENVEE